MKITTYPDKRCACSVCNRSRLFEEHIAPLPERSKVWLTGILNHLLCVEEELNFLNIEINKPVLSSYTDNAAACCSKCGVRINGAFKVSNGLLCGLCMDDERNGR